MIFIVKAYTQKNMHQCTCTMYIFKQMHVSYLRYMYFKWNKKLLKIMWSKWKPQLSTSYGEDEEHPSPKFSTVCFVIISK